MEADHLCGFNFISPMYICKMQNKPIKYFLIIFLLSRVMDELCTSHLVWRGISDVQGSFWSLPIAPCLLRLVSLKIWSQMYCQSVIQAGTPVHKTHSSALTVHWVGLAAAYVDIQECAVTKEFCVHRLLAASVCNLRNHFYI
jgi:hypothetical protein